MPQLGHGALADALLAESGEKGGAGSGVEAGGDRHDDFVVEVREPTGTGTDREV